MARTLGPQLAGGTASLYAAVSEEAKGDLLLGQRVRRIVETGEPFSVLSACVSNARNVSETSAMICDTRCSPFSRGAHLCRGG